MTKYALRLIDGFLVAQPLRKRRSATPPATAFSTNDAGRVASEHNDCSVRAWAIAKQLPYAEAHAAFKAAGRPDRGRTPWRVSVAVMGQPTFQPRWKSDCPTYAQWVRENPAGRWVVIVRGHAFAVVDGVHLDMGAAAYKPRARVLLAWRVA